MESLAKAIVETFRFLIHLSAALPGNSLASNSGGDLSAQDHTIAAAQVLSIFQNYISFLTQLFVEICKQVQITMA